MCLRIPKDVLISTVAYEHCDRRIEGHSAVVAGSEISSVLRFKRLR